MIKKGSLVLSVNGSRNNYAAPCVAAIRENADVEIISSHMLAAKVITFAISFINLNLTYDIVNSGKYQRIYNDYNFPPLNIFSDIGKSFFGCIALNKDSLNQLGFQFREVKRAIFEQTDYRWSCRARLHLNMILEQCNEQYIALSDKSAASYKINESNVWVSLIKEKIHSDYNKNISLATLADYVKINRTTVAKRFREIVGVSVTKYIIGYRIKCACISLATTDLSIEEIAFECGFNSKSYFIRQFSKIMNTTPNRFRKQCLATRRSPESAEILRGVDIL